MRISFAAYGYPQPLANRKGEKSIDKKISETF